MTDEKRYTGSDDLRWYFWDGGFLAAGVGSKGVLSEHAHHAIQLWFCIEGPSLLKYGEDHWREYVAGMVAADEPHAYDPNDMRGVMLLVDPESREGKWLKASMKAPVQSMLESRIDETREVVKKFLDEPPDEEGTTQVVDYIVRQVCTGSMPNA